MLLFQNAQTFNLEGSLVRTPAQTHGQISVVLYVAYGRRCLVPLAATLLAAFENLVVFSHRAQQAIFNENISSRVVLFFVPVNSVHP